MFPSINSSALEVAVLDQSKYHLSLARSMLANIGVRRIRSYDRVVVALDELIAEPSGLLIIDSELPQHSSCLRLLRCLRNHKLAPLCFVPIIVTVREPTHSFIEAAIRAGSNYVLAKPYSPLSLKQRIDRVIADNSKLVLRDDQYVLAEMLDSMDARAMAANPSLLAALFSGGGEARTSVAPNTKLARQTLIDMLKSPDNRKPDDKQSDDKKDHQ